MGVFNKNNNNIIVDNDTLKLLRNRRDYKIFCTSTKMCLTETGSPHN